jgi:cytochrome c biogenesis protein CcmG, thiol:disulfide interchange protein DsbE
MTATRPRPRPRAADSPSEGGGINRNVVFVVVGAIVAVLLAAVVVFAVSGGEDEASSAEIAPTGEVQIVGEALPASNPEAGLDTTDPAIGMLAPEVTAPVLGAGNRVTLGNFGTPRVIAFLAHWCPHCQNEVAALTDWLAAGNQLPSGVDYQAVSIRQSPGRDQYPPSAWLESQGWPFQTVIDDENALIDRTFGVGGTPFYIFVDAEGRIAGRVGGGLAPEDMARMMESLKAGTLTGPDEAGEQSDPDAVTDTDTGSTVTTAG